MKGNKSPSVKMQIDSITGAGLLTQQFELNSDFAPSGDQPSAIKGLMDGLGRGEREQVLLGV
ncbi:uncharacterized protein METZ01_LOCUS255258, partial [marine metagenome]